MFLSFFVKDMHGESPFSGISMGNDRLGDMKRKGGVMPEHYYIDKKYPLYL